MPMSSTPSYSTLVSSVLSRSTPVVITLRGGEGCREGRGAAKGEGEGEGHRRKGASERGAGVDVANGVKVGRGGGGRWADASCVPPPVGRQSGRERGRLKRVGVGPIKNSCAVK